MGEFTGKIAKKRLGRTGLTVPVLSLGGYGLGKTREDMDDTAAIATVHYALEQGIDYIDTSPMYGETTSERRIGLALRGVPRTSFLLSTKVGSHPERKGNYCYDATMWSIESSMKLLHVDYFDLVHIHDPDRLAADGLTTAFGPHGALEALEGLKREGVVRAIGMGQRRLDFHLKGIESGRLDALLTFRDYNPVNRDAVSEVIPLAKKQDMGVINATVLIYGLMGGKDPESLAPGLINNVSSHELNAAKKLYRWCNEKKIPVQAVVFQFCLREKLVDCTLTGARTVEQLRDNLEAVTWELPAGIWEEFDTLDLPNVQ